MLTATQHDTLARVRDALATAGHGSRAAIVAEATRALGCTPATLYRWLGQAGFDSQRKRRSDAGASLLSDAELQLVAGVLLASANNKGQRMPVATAMDMLRASGKLVTDVSESTVSRQLHERRLHPDQVSRPTPSVQMASKHPNHVWQVDSTTGAFYYLPGGRLRWMPADEFYKNKVANLVKASTDLLTRYSAVDHTSHAGKVRHYLGGETAENLVDFVTWAMWKQDDSPLHGVPLILVMDPGAANKGTLMRNFCARVGVKLLHHAPGAARVTGSVEKFHDLVRMHFESRLRFVDRSQVDLEWLNREGSRWAAAYCAHSVHGRHGKTRYGKWLEIRAEELRVAASLEALREAAMREPVTRRVSNQRTIELDGRTYDLALVPGVVPGLKVTAAVNPFRAPAIDVLHADIDTGEQTWHVVEPAQVDAHGFRAGAPVWGEDHPQIAAYGDVDRARNELTRQAYRTGDGLPTLEEAAKARKANAQAYAGVVDGMADVHATPVPTFIPRRATVLELPERRVEARRITAVEAAKRLRDVLGSAYMPQIYTDLVAQWPEGVPEAELEPMAERWRAAAARDDQGGDRAAGGAA